MGGSRRIGGCAILRAGALVAATGCFSDAPEIELAPTSAADSSSSDSGESASESTSESTTASDSTGSDVPNLLDNGSFEAWPTATPTSWVPTATVSLAPTGDAAHDGAIAARLELTAYGELRQSVGLAVPLATGEQVAAEMAYRRVSGDTSPPGIDLYGTRASDGVEILIPAITTGPFVGDEWTIGGGSVVMPEPVTALRIAVVAGGFGPQTVDIDAVRLWIVE